FGTLAFYPSLGYNLIRNFIQPTRWQWYNRIDDSLILGAMPFQSMSDELIQNENVGGVVCCTEEFELKAAYQSMGEAEWAAKGVRFHHVPMTDFFGSTGRQEMEGAVGFIKQIAKDGKSVYVHCKAGRTRSATVATCYLMDKNKWLPNVAFEFLRTKRHQALLRNAHWRTCNEFQRYLDASPATPPS
ncbi:hypothetical protein PFISCL1PPCAC_4022, partial [Pristionchus fissidentatus]